MIVDPQSYQRLKADVKHLWHRLTESEIEALKDRRDIFFLAVRKKHGVLRAQAEQVLHDIANRTSEAA